MHRLGAGLAAIVAILVATPASVDAHVSHSNALASKKGGSPAVESLPLLATLVQTHTDERVPLDDRSPTQDRFSQLLADRVTGERHELDPKLLELLRSLARKHPGARIELVSGYRSAKLNEMMRKKGHHVASHSQHSLGHAVDFRIVLPDSDPLNVRGFAPDTRTPERPSSASGAPRGIAPPALEKEIRDLGWEGGVGVYPSKSDWFVHADVGKNRRWLGN